MSAAGNCDDPATPIHAVQGAGASSPMVGDSVVVEGVVVGEFQARGRLSGFFVQEEDDDIDDSPLTSEGIFVFAGESGPDVNAGDVVRVQGKVTEFHGLTEIASVKSIVICQAGGSGSAGVATLLTRASPAGITLPLGADDDLERYEGMAVCIPQTLHVVDTYNLGRFGQVELAAKRLLAPTNDTPPGEAARGRADLNRRSRIRLDDGSRLANPRPLPPYIAPALENGQGTDQGTTLRAGDTVKDLAGVLGFGYGNYEVHPTTPVTFSRINRRSPAPAEIEGTVRVASLNAHNYFTTLDDGSRSCGPRGNLSCRGANTAVELRRQQEKLVAALIKMDADIVGLIEVENNASASTRSLVDAVNVASAGTGASPAETLASPGGNAPGTPYRFIDTGAIGTGAIKAAFIYKPARVQAVGDFALLDSSVDATFNDRKNRPVLAQTFESVAGERVTIAITHFKSKGSACDDIGDPDTGDGQGDCNLTRTAAAQALVRWLAGDPTASGDPGILIIGDLNAYTKEDPVSVIKDAGYTDLVSRYSGTGTYTYAAFGEAGVLDHAFASRTLAVQITGVTIWHINADEPRALDYNDFNQPALYRPDPYRSSDHDPVVVGLFPQ